MTSSTMYHPGLTFATLVVQFVTVNGALIPSTSLEPRRRGGGPDGSGDGGDPEPGATNTTSNSTGGTSAPQASSTSANSTSQSATLPVSSPSTSPTSTSASVSSTTSSSSGSSNSSGASPVVGAVRSNISTPGIIGAVIGSVIIGGLIVTLLAWCIRRARRAPKSPRGALPIAFLSRSPRAQTPMTEMSQTQSNPLISSAVAAGLTSNPFQTRYARSFSPSTTTASLSPLNLTTSLQHTRSVASSSDRGTAYTAATTHTAATTDLELLQTPNSSPLMGTSASLLPIITAAANLASPSASESSGLHRAMTAHQKALEQEDVKGREEANMDIEKVEGVNDPPPEYNA